MNKVKCVCGYFGTKIYVLTESNEMKKIDLKEIEGKVVPYCVICEAPENLKVVNTRLPNPEYD